MPQSPPRAQAALSGEAQPCAGSQAPPLPPPPTAAHAPGPPGDGSSKCLRQHPLPSPPPPPQDLPGVAACLCSQDGLLPAVFCDAPSTPSGSAAGRPDYLSNALDLPMGCSAPSPNRGQRAVLQPLRSWCCPALLRTGAVPPRPGSPPGNQPVWPWRWTFLYYCEVLFMKNLEGESARPGEMVVFLLFLPHSSKIPPLRSFTSHPAHPHACSSPPPEPCPPCLPTSPGPEQTSVGPCKGME